MGAAAGGTLVLGLGNDIAGNDGVGLAVARAVARRLDTEGLPEVGVELSSESYVCVLDHLFERSRLIVIDAMDVAPERVGSVEVFGVEAAPARGMRQAHQCGLSHLVGRARSLANRSGAAIDVVGIGIPSQSYVDLHEGLCDEVSAAVERACDTVLALCRRHGA